METVTKKSARSKKPVRMTNEFVPRFWEDSDGRCAVVKTIKRRYELLKEDSQADSIQRDLLCQRVAFVSTVLESQEVRCAEGGDLDLGSYVQGVNSLQGLLKTLGLERKLKQAGGLRDYLAAKEKEGAV